MAEKLLKECRKNFVKRVNPVILNNLLDDLLEEGVLNEGEVALVMEGNTVTSNKARDLIDMVTKKGRNASEILIQSMKKRDPHLSAALGIETNPGRGSHETLGPSYRSPTQETSGSSQHPSNQEALGSLQISGTQETSIKILPSPAPVSEALQHRQQSPAAEIPADHTEHWITPCTQDVFERIQKEKFDQIYAIKDKSIRKRLALIINNLQFSSLSERKGSEIDEEGMSRLLKELGYQVEIEKNLSSADMESSLKHFSTRKEHVDSDSTFIVIMSHGVKEGICGTDCAEGKMDILPLDTIYNIFNNIKCKALRDKPKIILIQTCRGEQRSVVLVTDSICPASDAIPVPPSDDDLEEDAMYKTLRESDLICFWSTTPDTVSWRDPNKGSPFIQHLIEILRKKACRSHLEDIFREVQLSFKHSGRQMPTKERATLMKKFYLFPGH